MRMERGGRLPDGGNACCPQKGVEGLLNVDPDRGGRFVQKHQRRPAGEDPRDGQALHLSRREGLRTARGSGGGSRLRSPGGGLPRINAESMTSSVSSVSLVHLPLFPPFPSALLMVVCRFGASQRARVSRAPRPQRVISHKEVGPESPLATTSDPQASWLLHAPGGGRAPPP